MTKTTAELQKRFEPYKKARQEREKLEDSQKAELAPLKTQIAEIKEKHEADIDQAEERETKLRQILVEASRTAKRQGKFGDKARQLLFGGYVEVQAPKLTLKVSDLETFLAWPGAYLAVTGIVLDQDVLLLLNNRGRSIPGITEMKHLPVVKISIKGGL